MSDHALRPAYRLETERLVLRCWSPRDAPRVRAALDRSDAHLRPWVPFMKAEPRSLEETMHWLRTRRAWFDQGSHAAYGAFTPDETELVGEALLLRRDDSGALEIGYWIDVAHCGHGYATEAAAALTRLGFELEHADRIDICCATENAPSAAVPARLGYTHTATLPRHTTDTEGTPRDLAIWSLFPEEFSGSPAARARLRASDVLGRELGLGAR